ncbi:MAG: hypothetical protein HQM08_29220 [Candidatus Riflebacteria bacterium]|nr:hypothetical protein [Candidatus Riflebacteria bacterium]
MPKVTFNLSEQDHQAFKIFSMLEKKSMSAILTKFIRKMTKKVDFSKLAQSKNLGEYLLSMPITEGDEFDQKVLKEIRDNPEEPEGTWEDLKKECGLS